jgi:hypothetical protein
MKTLIGKKTAKTCDGVPEVAEAFPHVEQIVLRTDDKTINGALIPDWWHYCPWNVAHSQSSERLAQKSDIANLARNWRWEHAKNAWQLGHSSCT